LTRGRAATSPGSGSRPCASHLDELDVLVDGDYREELRDLTLHFRGSRNQRVIDLAATRATGTLTLLYADE